MNVNTEKGVIQGVHMIIQGDDTMHEGGLGGRGRDWWTSIGRRAGIMSVAHHHGWRVGVCRNQYGFM